MSNVCFRMLCASDKAETRSGWSITTLARLLLGVASVAVVLAGYSGTTGTLDIVLLQRILVAIALCTLMALSARLLAMACMCRWWSSEPDVHPPVKLIPSHRISFESDWREMTPELSDSSKGLSPPPPLAPLTPMPDTLWRRLKKRASSLRPFTCAPRPDAAALASLTRPIRRRNTWSRGDAAGRVSASGRSEAVESAAARLPRNGFLRRSNSSGCSAGGAPPTGRKKPVPPRITVSPFGQLASQGDDNASPNGYGDLSPSTSCLLPGESVGRGVEAAACAAHELTAPANKQASEAVTDGHLLQFSKMLNEASAAAALAEHAAADVEGSDRGCLYGAVDCPDLYQQGWEPVVHEHKQGLHFWAWRRPVRKGLFMYKTRAVYERAVPQQMVLFHFDDDFRREWDNMMTVLHAIPAPNECAAPSTPGGGGAVAAPTLSHAEVQRRAHGRSTFMYSVARFPPPMASREYTYARRVWARPDDGGVYSIARSCPHPAPPHHGGRLVRVDDYWSGMVVRAADGIDDHLAPAVEVITIYFEDPHMRAGLVNMAVRRGLWPLLQKYEAAFRRHQNMLDMPCGGCGAGGSAAAALRVAAASAAPAVDGAAGREAGQEEGAELVAVQIFSETAVPPASLLLSMQSLAGSMTSEVLGSITQSWCPTVKSRLQLLPRLYAAYLGLWRGGAAAATRAQAAGVAVARAVVQAVVLFVRFAAAGWLLWLSLVAKVVWLVGWLLWRACAVAVAMYSASVFFVAAAYQLAGRAMSASYWQTRRSKDKGSTAAGQWLGVPTNATSCGGSSLSGRSEETESDAGSSDYVVGGTGRKGGRDSGGAFARQNSWESSNRLRAWPARRAGGSRRSGGGSAPFRSLRLRDFDEADVIMPPSPLQPLAPMTSGDFMGWAETADVGAEGGMARDLYEQRASGRPTAAAAPFGFRRWAAGLAVVAIKGAVQRVLSKANGEAAALAFTPTHGDGSSSSSTSRQVSHHQSCGGPAGVPAARSSSGCYSAARVQSMQSRAVAALGEYGASSGGLAAGSMTLCHGVSSQEGGTVEAGRVAVDLERRFIRRRAFV